MSQYTQAQAAELLDMVYDFRAFYIIAHQPLTTGHQQERFAAERMLDLLSDSISERMKKTFPDEVTAEGTVSL